MDIARRAGVAHTINATTTDLHEALSEITRGQGPDVIIEAVGNPQTYRAAIDEVTYTGRVVYIGYAKKPVAYETGMFVQKEIKIYGSRNSEKDTDFPAVIAYLESGRFPTDDVVSRTVTLDEAGAALAEWSEHPGPVTKILVDTEAS
jgi:threonine dehydrogenase-like Zn-dependent dehydrogenase